MNAPIHPLGLERYQAGPIVAIPINGCPAKALMDSGFTSTMKSCWCLIQRDYCVTSGIAIDPTTKYRITLADGTASETDGTAEITLQFPHGKFSVTARVYHMPDPDTFDILLGHSFMLEHDVSVWNDSTSEGPQHGIRFPGGTVFLPQESLFRSSHHHFFQPCLRFATFPNVRSVLDSGRVHSSSIFRSHPGRPCTRMLHVQPYCMSSRIACAAVQPGQPGKVVR